MHIDGGLCTVAPLNSLVHTRVLAWFMEEGSTMDARYVSMVLGWHGIEYGIHLCVDESRTDSKAWAFEGYSRKCHET